MARRTDSGPSVASEGGAGRETQGKKQDKALRLSVSSFTKRSRRTSEKNFERKFFSALTKAGYPNWHMAVREAGWPDRYASGGHWFELKSLGELSDRSGLSEAQISHLNMLSKAGDKCYYVAKLEGGVIFAPWKDFWGKCDLSPVKAIAMRHRYAYKTEADLLEMIRYVLA